MMRLHSAMIGLVVLAGCSTPGPGPGPRPPVETRSSFQCDNGERVSVRFFPQQGIAVLERGGQNVELQQQRTGSGFLYSNGQTSIRGRGNEMTMTVGMMAPTRCVELAGGPPPPAGGGDDPVLEGSFFYRCQNGERVEVRFFPQQGVAVLVRNGRSHELQQQPTRVGFIFAGADYQVQGRGENLQLIPAGQSVIECRMER